MRCDAMSSQPYPKFNSTQFARFPSQSINQSINPGLKAEIFLRNWGAHINVFVFVFVFLLHVGYTTCDYRSTGMTRYSSSVRRKAKLHIPIVEDGEVQLEQDVAVDLRP